MSDHMGAPSFVGYLRSVKNEGCGGWRIKPYQMCILQIFHHLTLRGE